MEYESYYTVGYLNLTEFETLLLKEFRTDTKLTIKIIYL